MSHIIRFREQRGSLDDSMKTVVELQATLEAVAKHLKVEANRVEVKSYGFDSRTGWEMFIVTVDGNGVGFTNGPVL